MAIPWPKPNFLTKLSPGANINTGYAIYRVVLPILDTTGKIKNPWPFMDSYSGALLHQYGITEYNFYTLHFRESRSLGVLAQLIPDRLCGMPTHSPSSFPLSWFKQKAEGTAEGC